MTNKLVVIINSYKVPKIKNVLLYEIKFLVPNYSCLHNPWLGGYRPQIPILSVLCPLLNLLNPPPPNRIPGYATASRPEVDSASNRNEYQEYLLGGLDGRCVRLTNLPPSCPVYKIWQLQPPGVQPSNGIPLPLLVVIINLFVFFLVFQFLPSCIVFFHPFYCSFPCVVLPHPFILFSDIIFLSSSPGRGPTWTHVLRSSTVGLH